MKSKLPYLFVALTVIALSASCSSSSPTIVVHFTEQTAQAIVQLGEKIFYGLLSAAVLHGLLSSK